MSQVISHYEILSRIGAGGMGEVYRARDTRLGRTVALKFLPEAFSRDRERLSRFQREAQVLASLNHPSIASLYGFEEAEGKPFLVMELAEGESLDQRVRRGPVPVDECLSIALQIAQALEEAHDHGVIHRDLKPGNIHVTDEGKVKVLDFGLARLLEADSGSETAETLERSPTITRVSEAGVILGTASYMSPEQARGRRADRRSDVWSFGVVLLEMLTGRRVFEGETITEILAAIMKDPIPLERLPGETPVPLRFLVARCLERDPKRRLQAIGEARIALEGMRGSGDSGTAAASGVVTIVSGRGPGPQEVEAGGAAPDSVSRAAPAAPGGRRLAAAVPWAVAVICLALGAMAWLRGAGGPAGPPEGPVRKFLVRTGTLDTGDRRAAILSPDGRRIAYVQGDGIRIRDLFALEPRILVSAPGRPPEELPANPIWSPDSRQIAYIASARLWRISVEGGTPSAICSVGAGFSGGTWLPDDRIVFTVPRGNMFEVSARGGDPKVLLAREENDIDFHDPWGLPGGRAILYTLHRKEGVDTIEVLADGKRRQLLRVPVTDASTVQVVNMVSYAPSGHLLYQRDQGNIGIWALPFSLDALEAAGEPFLVAAYGKGPSISEDGTLLYVPGREETPRRLVWVDRQGEIGASAGEALRGLTAPALSPDGTRVAYAAEDNGAGEIWVQDLGTGTRTRLTFTPADENLPRWIPGQNRVAFVSALEGRSVVSARAADGSGEAVVLAEEATAPEFTPDGRWLIYQGVSETRAGLMHRPMGGQGGEEVILPGAGSNLYGAALSPDGRYIAYLSWERGTPTTYIRPYPAGEGKWELPASWESVVVWQKDRIFYTTDRPEPALMEIPASLPGTLSLGTPRKLFDLGPQRLLKEAFSVASDGRRILMVQDTAPSRTPEEVAVVESWLSEFRDAPAAR